MPLPSSDRDVTGAPPNPGAWAMQRALMALAVLALPATDAVGLLWQRDMQAIEARLAADAHATSAHLRSGRPCRGRQRSADVVDSWGRRGVQSVAAPGRGLPARGVSLDCALALRLSGHATAGRWPCRVAGRSGDRAGERGGDAGGRAAGAAIRAPSPRAHAGAGAPNAPDGRGAGAAGTAVALWCAVCQRPAVLGSAAAGAGVRRPARPGRAEDGGRGGFSGRHDRGSSSGDAAARRAGG